MQTDDALPIEPLAALQHWSVVDQDGVFTLWFDQHASKVNTLSTETLAELEQLLDYLDKQSPSAVLIRSAKKTGFIAGADVKDFRNLTDQLTTRMMIDYAHHLLGRIESLPWPTVAVIHGFCLGGGLELALACDYRLAREDLDSEDRCRIGFPEVSLGIFPGFGGTVRSLRTIGHLPAMNMMLTGKPVNARQAARLGLVDQVVPARQLDNRIKLLLQRPPPVQRATGVVNRLLQQSWLRKPIHHWLQQKVAAKANPRHYPAPTQLLDHWLKYADEPKALYENEAETVSTLLIGKPAQGLIRSFLLQERMKRSAKTDYGPVKHVHVIGAGVMGGDIASWCALQGLQVSLQDQQPHLLERAMARAHKLFEKKARNPLVVQRCIDRLVPDCAGDGISKADCVIEAIVEDIDAKQAVYAQVEPQLKPNALLLTNTSSIPLETLSAGLQQPQRLVGLHFFNPVAQMQLVEIIRSSATDPTVVEQTQAFAKQLKKLPVQVKSSPGFLVNRILMPYLLEAVRCYEQGYPAAQIDQAATAFGMPMGPITLADTVGLDICLSVAEMLAEPLQLEVPNSLRQMVAKKQLGKKTGQGYYQYGKAGINGLKRTANAPAADPELTNRLIYRLLNEAVACWREQLVEDADLLDAGVIYGTGFAPFTGGPMHYINQQGQQHCLQQLQQVAPLYGTGFQPDTGWQQHWSLNV